MFQIILRRLLPILMTVSTDIRALTRQHGHVLSVRYDGLFSGFTTTLEEKSSFCGHSRDLSYCMRESRRPNMRDDEAWHDVTARLRHHALPPDG